MATDQNEEPHENIQVLQIDEDLRESYLSYAMSVIISRALPDVRDGLKPVHRRVLFAMRELGNLHNRPYKKSARVVGDVIGKYHPHGDTAVYDTIVRMAQPFAMRYMLVDGQGNFGSVDGDAAAAMRYTEVRMSRLAHELLSDLDRETVDFVPNYDETEQEPQVMPTRVPNLLVNGSAGIAVGMATNIPPHNLTEVINACLAVIDNPDVDIAGLMEHMPGPDFPTAGIINGAQGIYAAYRTGRGRVYTRARASVEEDKRGRERIVVSVGAVLMGVMLFWGLVIAPLDSSVTRLGQRVDDKRELIVWMQQAAVRIKGAGPGAAAAGDGGEGSLVVLVDRSARSAGLGSALTRNQPVGEDGIRIPGNGIMSGSTFDGYQLKVACNG